MISEKEFLEETVKLFQICPLCGSSEGFIAKGRFVKVIECNGCKSQWEAVTMLDSCRYTRGVKNNGEHYLKLFYWPSKIEYGRYFEGKPFSIEFWTNPEKPYQKYAFYAEKILGAFEKLQRAPSEVCKIKIEDKTNVSVYGPSGDLVALIMPSVEGSAVTMAIVDYSTNLWGNDKKIDQNDSFYLLLSMLVDRLEKRFKERGEEFPVIIYRIWQGKLEKVEKNTFYPLVPRQIVISDTVLNGLKKCGVIVSTGPGEYEFSFWN